MRKDWSINERSSDTSSQPDRARRNPLVASIPIATGLLGAGALAGLAGRWWWVFDLASQYRAQYFWGFLLCTLAAALLRRRRVCAVACLFLVWHGVLLWPFFSPFHDGPAGAAAGGRKLRIVTLNVHFADPRSERVIDFVRSANPDVAAFEDVDETWRDALQNLRDGWPYVHEPEDRPPVFNILFSRLPLEASRIEVLSDAKHATIARVEAGDVPLTLFAVHTTRPTTHVGAVHQGQQLSSLAALVAAESGEKVVIGDFNSTSWSPVFADFQRATGLRDSRVGRGVQPSWPASLPALLRIPIDQCLVSPTVFVTGRTLGPDVGSHHLPVVIDLAMPLRDGAKH